MIHVSYEQMEPKTRKRLYDLGIQRANKEVNLGIAPSAFEIDFWRTFFFGKTENECKWEDDGGKN